MDRKKFISLFGLLPLVSFEGFGKTNALELTCDPYVFIEERRMGYISYREVKNGKIIRRWEVTGTCNGCGKCWQGAVGDKPILDCPVSPEFKIEEGCPLKPKEL